MEEYNVYIFRDPHAFLRDEILRRNFEGADVSLLGIVDNLTYDTALLVFHVLDARMKHNFSISDEEFATFIMSE